MQINRAEIAIALGVSKDFETSREIEHRVTFLVEYLSRSAAKSLVLGISGGVDSLTAGILSQKAVERHRANGGASEFIAVRLPYGQQTDEDDARACLEVIQADRVVTVDIKPAADAMFAQVLNHIETERCDFQLGNVKARQRMIAQYAIAGGRRGLVVGTDHAAEAVMGFFTKYGDGAADILPLSGLTKRRVRAIARALGAPERLVLKVPTADLECEQPLKPDEDVYGVTYENIDDFLEGAQVPDHAMAIILRAYQTTAHKRALPVTPFFSQQLEK